MHFYSVAFILALLAFGGIAAYVGDILGYRLGKRRLSLLRLRPRTTARLVGILAGILIPAVTVLVGYWQVDYVRIALVELDDLRLDLDRLHHERDTMAEQRDLLRKERNGLRKQHSQARREADESRNELQGVQTDLNTAKGHLADARARVSRLRAESGRLRADKQQVEEDLEAADRSLEAAESALDAVQGNLQQVVQEKQRAEEQRDDLEDQVARLERRQATLQDQVDAVQEEWEARLSLSAGRRFILDLGAELVRGVVERPGDLDALKNEIVALLLVADQAAEAGGAAMGDNDRYVRAVGPAPPDALPEDQKWPPESRVLGYVVGQLWEADERSHVVRLIVARRTFLREQAYVVFTWQPNRLIFRKGEAIVSRQMEAGLDETEAFEQLWLLIADPSRSEVRKQAQAAGMLPDPVTGRYGEIHIRELFRAARECAERTEPATVKVEAAADSYTAGPLAVRIVVQPSGGGGR